MKRHIAVNSIFAAMVAGLMLAIAVLVLAAAKPVKAADIDIFGGDTLKDSPRIARNWQGFGVDISAGTTFGNIELDAGGFTLDGIGYDGIGARLAARYYLQRGALVFGPSCGASFETTAFETTFGDLEADRRLYCDAHVGAQIGNSLIYLLGGVSWTHVQFDAISYDDDIFGIRLGGGAKTKLSDNWTLGLEGVYTDHEDQDFGPVTLKPEDVSVWVVLGYQFN